MSYTVGFAPVVQEQLDSLEDFVSSASSPEIAARYVDAIVTYCESLSLFPERGLRRDDILPGLRLTNYRRNTVIAFLVDTASESVSILGVFYGGQDYDSILRADSEG